MLHLKSTEEIEAIRRSCWIVSETLAHVSSHLKPGVTGLEIDRIAEDFIRDQGAIPAFLGYKGFPATLCISKNEVVVHGIPNNTPFQEGDVVSVDCGVLYEGFYGDAAYTFAFAGVSDEVGRLLSVTKASLYYGITFAVVGNRIGDIAHAIQEKNESAGYEVVRELVGHGIGRNLHEPPEVPNYGTRGKGPVLKAGMTLAIEPMINMGTRQISYHEDGWTITTRDGKPSAHFEHSIAVRETGPDILSDHDIIEKMIKKNPDLKQIL